MLILSASAGREIVEAIGVNTAVLKRLEGEVGDVKEALKDLKDEVGDVKKALKRIEGKADGKTAALKRVEDSIPTRGKERHSEHV